MMPSEPQSEPPLEELSAGERRSRIAQMVSANGRVHVTSLVQQFGVTETSIRRDLTLLERAGRLQRVHGGAIPRRGSSRSDSFAEKMGLQMEAKMRIGKAAAELIRSRDIILLDSGTTTLQIVQQIPMALRENNMVTLVTNSQPIAQEVLTWASPNLTILGGLFLPDYQATVGPQTLTQLRELTADKLFLGADGLTLGGGATTANILMAQVDGTMVEQAREVILVLDSSKIGRAGFVPIKPVDSIHKLITDASAPPEFVEAVRARGVDVLQV